MKKAFYYWYLLFWPLLAQADHSNLCELFYKTGATTPSQMTDVAWMSGAIKPSKMNQFGLIIQKTFDNYHKKPNTQLCAEIERNLANANMLNFQSNLPPKEKYENKTLQTIKQTEVSQTPIKDGAVGYTENTNKPNNIYEALQGLRSRDSHKIYNTLKKNGFFADEAKKDNRRKEIIDDLNKTLANKSGNLNNDDIEKIQKALVEKNYLKK